MLELMTTLLFVLLPPPLDLFKSQSSLKVRFQASIGRARLPFLLSSDLFSNCLPTAAAAADVCSLEDCHAWFGSAQMSKMQRGDVMDNYPPLHRSRGYAIRDELQKEEGTECSPPAVQV